MKKQINFLLSVPAVAIGTLLLLLVPFVAMQFSDEVKWGIADFIVMGILIFSTGLSFVLIARQKGSLVYRAAVGSAIGITFLLIWANLAVGLIGSGPNAANLMYGGVVGLVIIGTILSRFTAGGMENAMFAATLSLVLVAGIELLTNMDEYPGSSVKEVIMVNGFFAFLYAISGLLFRHVALQESPEKSNG